jgi:membrane protein implicated in regulation of membrane protease activity
MTPTLRRYIVLQVPGVVIAGAVAAMLWLGSVVSGWVALAAFVAWLVKDVVLYPFVKSAYETTIPSGAERLVGETGTAATAFDPSGRVRIRGEIWNARLEREGRLESGSRVIVVASEGLTLIVRAPDGHPSVRV